MQESRAEYIRAINEGLSADDVARRHKEQVEQRIEELRTIDSFSLKDDIE